MVDKAKFYGSDGVQEEPTKYSPEQVEQITSARSSGEGTPKKGRGLIVVFCLLAIAGGTWSILFRKVEDPVVEIPESDYISLQPPPTKQKPKPTTAPVQTWSPIELRIGFHEAFEKLDYVRLKDGSYQFSTDFLIQRWWIGLDRLIIERQGSRGKTDPKHLFTIELLIPGKTFDLERGRALINFWKRRMDILTEVDRKAGGRAIEAAFENKIPKTFGTTPAGASGWEYGGKFRFRAKVRDGVRNRKITGPKYQCLAQIEVFEF